MSDICNPSKKIPPVSSPYIVGIGASAGGLEALRSFFSAMPTDVGVGYVVIQHLAPDHKSMMVELLGRSTRLEVVRAEEGMKVEPDRIHLIQPGFNLSIREGVLHLEPMPQGKTLNLPIDLFFRCLAEDAKERAIAVVLSGTGSDGARGIRTIKELGGLVMVQAEASAKFAGMPASAIATGTADFVLPVEEMPEQLVQFLRHPFAPLPGERAARISSDSEEINLICKRLQKYLGLNFGTYKRGTLARRIERRMNVTQLQDLAAYRQYLEDSGTEVEALTKDLLIGVTKFFRDPELFAALKEPIRQLFAELPDGGCLRCWVTACSTGEEAYTLAILCEEARRELGRQAVDFKVFGTDVDKTALEIAGAGVYPQSVVADIPTDLLNRYFESQGDENFMVRRTLRDHLIFARQDLLSDPPFTRIHILSCRNLLIYLQPSAQRKLLGLFHFGLVSDGLLFLGSSETLGDLSYAFEPVNSKARLFRKTPGISLRMSDAIPSLEENAHWAYTREEESGGITSTQRKGILGERLQSFVLRKYAPATLVVDSQGQLVFTGGDAARFLRVPTGRTALAIHQLLPRDLGLAVSTVIRQAQRDRRIAEMGAVSFQPDGEEARISLRVKAEPFDVQAGLGWVTVVTFMEEVSMVQDPHTAEPYKPDAQLLSRVEELEAELRSTRESLQSSVEQQETANEELQAANEELLASNEELQSTNEELESVNEELYTVNAEYQGKIQELTDLNDDMENFTRSSDIGTIFFDRDLYIRRFTPEFARITGLSEVDEGRLLSTFAHPVLQRIQSLSGKVLVAREQIEQVVDLKDKGAFLLRVSPYRVEKNDTKALVASLVDISRIRDTELQIATLLDTLDVGVCITDEQGNFVKVNQAYCRLYGYSEDELIGESFVMVVPEAFREEAQRLHDCFIQDGEEIPGVWQVVDKQNHLHRVAVQARLMVYTDGTRCKVTVVSDLDELKRLTEQDAIPVGEENRQDGI